MQNFTTLIIWVVVVGVAFAILWRKGFLLRVANYISETREELRKCTWPTVQELKGSTTVVMVTIALLGAFTVFVDLIISRFISFIT
ncbi:MAG: preprotein translocase subunit SecE [Verrucomicrobia bacterium]|nr:preprotein translocase subunit SecE [Verrucomicrobiota bacterium]